MFFVQPNLSPGRSPDPGRGCHGVQGELPVIPDDGLSIILIQMSHIDPKHASLEDPVCHLIVLLWVAQFLYGRSILSAEFVLDGKLSSTNYCYSPLCVSTNF